MATMITDKEAFRLVATRMEKIFPPSISWNEEKTSDLVVIEELLSTEERNHLASQLGCQVNNLQDPTYVKRIIEARIQQEWQQVSTDFGPIVSEKEYVFLRRTRSHALLLDDKDDVNILSGMLSSDEMAEYDGFEDNGGDPEGNAWLIWELDVSLIEAARRSEIPFTGIDGYELSFPHVMALSEFNLRGRWSGISCSDLVFVEDDWDAVRLLRTDHYIKEHDLDDIPDEELLEHLAASLDPAQVQFLSVLQGKEQTFHTNAIDIEVVCVSAISQVLDRYRLLSQALLWSSVGNPRVYGAYTSSPLRTDLETLVGIVNGNPLKTSELVEKVTAASTRVFTTLCNPASPIPDPFWKTTCGELIRSVQGWLRGDDLINYSVAAEILWPGTTLSQSVATQRIQRLVLNGTLIRYKDPHEPNPRHAQRVSKIQVEELITNIKEKNYEGQ